MERVKEDFANSVVKQNPELMQSMNEMFESQRQEYMMYSSIGDSYVASGPPTKLSTVNMSTIDKQSASDFVTPPLIGKGDGYSAESALKDSLDPRMIDETMTELTRQTSQESYTPSLASNLPPVQ